MVIIVINTKAVVISHLARINIVIKRDRRIIRAQKVATGELSIELCNQLLPDFFFFHSAVTRTVIMRSIRVVMGKANTVHHQATNHLTKVRIVIGIRSAIKTRTRLKAALPATTRIARSPTNTKVPIAHQKISIPVAVARSTKAKIKTGTVTEVIPTRAAPADRSISTQTRIVAKISTRAQAHLTRTNRRRLATQIRSMLNPK